MNASPLHALPQERALGCFPIGRASGANPREPADMRARRARDAGRAALCKSIGGALPRGCWQLLRAMYRLLQNVNFVVHVI